MHHKVAVHIPEFVTSRLYFPQYDFQFNEIYGLVGPNGSGKSTLLKLCAGVLPESSLIHCAGKIAYLPVKDALDSTNTILDHDQLWDFSAKQSYFLQKHCRDQKISDLSAGQKKRLALDYFFDHAHDKDILLLDEPSNNLDEEMLNFLFHKLQEFQKNRCIIIADHFLDIRVYTKKITFSWDH